MEIFVDNNSNKFYQTLREDYDLMTRFEKRLKTEKVVMKQYVRKHGLRSVLDVACGTGLHSIILSQLGIQVVGSDISKEMLSLAEKNASHKSVNISWVQSSMLDLTKHITKTFDAVFCLGNSIPHILEKENLITTFKNFFQLLNKNGIVVIQLLNYQRILFEKKRIVAIHRIRNKEFIRFYDFLDDYIRFNILKIDWFKKKPEPFLQSTLLFPYIWPELKPVLTQCGFTNLEFYGSLNFKEFKKKDSNDLVVVGIKQ
jgi:2-polyprenyl-3-methyl-5-hydroxy-6-metoxy-1,4-benzoquinol methylase